MDQTDEPVNGLMILRGGLLHTPTFIGAGDILVGGGKILGLFTNNLPSEFLKQATVLDITGSYITPGLVDSHAHVTGGGGEEGPVSRVPEPHLSDFVGAGVTSVVGVTGTDSITRSLDALLAKVRALNKEGISAWMHTGAYRVPTPTLTGQVMRDLVTVEQVIGVKIALSDHRGSQPTFSELLRLASDARTGGLVGGKAGVVNCHIGSGDERLGLLWEIVRRTPIPARQFLPTHVSRTTKLLDDGKKWLEAGGSVDLTAQVTKDKTARVLTELKAETSPLDRVTVSSDAFGSLPKFDKDGEFVGMGVAKPDTLLGVVTSLVKNHGWELEQALPFFTSNPASILKLPKGYIKVGSDADLLVLGEDLKLEYVFSRGALMKTPMWVRKGMFEDSKSRG